MKIVIAPDSFKESLRAEQVAYAIAAGVRKAVPGAVIETIPLADGGEGLLSCFKFKNHHIETCHVHGPLSGYVTAEYMIFEESKRKTAVIEMSSAAGMELVTPEQRNPLLTTTYGVGQLILDAYNKGCRFFYIGLGSSATSDCGCGMAQALGVIFYDSLCQHIEPAINAALNIQIKSINTENMLIDVSNCSFTAVCDVTNPLLGEYGAAFTYARQKGADDNQIIQIEQTTNSIVSVIEKETCKKLRFIPGSGAGGGIGVSIVAFLDGRLVPGMDIIFRETNFYNKINDADLIITGEGCIDPTTTHGKVISGVLKAASGKPVIALCGAIQGDIKPLYKAGITAVFPICPGPGDLEKAYKNTAKNLTRTALQVVKTFIAQNHL